jgi:hypothetical protein
MVERAEERADSASRDVMKDQSDEIRLLLEDIREKKSAQNTSNSVISE